jgi:elongation factor Ts
MPEITPTLISDLRGRTGQSESECKRALVESDGHLGKAIDYFRRRGAFPQRREPAEGCIAVMNCDDNRCGALVEINCTTEAAAKSGPVARLAAHAARLLLRHPDADITQAANANLNIDEVSQQTGESVRIGRTAFLRNKDGQVGTYNHADGRIGVLVSVTGRIDEQLLKDLCLQVAGQDPKTSPLLEQPFIKDPAQTVAQALANCNCQLVEFVRVEVGQ